MRSFYNEAWALSSVRQLEDGCLFIFVNLIPACAEKLPSDGSLGLHQRQADPPCPKQILPGGISAPGIEVFLQDLIIEQIRASVHKAGVSRIELPQDQGTPVIAIEERARRLLLADVCYGTHGEALFEGSQVGGLGERYGGLCARSDHEQKEQDPIETAG